MNNITILGRVGREPEMRTTQGGMSVLSFPVADSKKIKGEEKTTWYDCTMFGDRGVALQQYIRKGDQITVTGEHELQTWDKDDGSKGFKCCVMVNNVGLVNSQQAPTVAKPAGQPAHTYQPPQPQGGFQQPQQGFGQQQPSGQAAPAPQGGGFPNSLDDDIPFNKFDII